MSLFNTEIFKGRVAVVTGGLSGIGEGTARILAELGCKVYAVGLDRKKVYEDSDSVVADFDGASIERVNLDVTDRAAVKAFVDGLDRLDFLINGAGVRFPEKEHEDSVFTRVIDINLNSIMNLCTVSRSLLAKSDKGAIVNFSSMFANFGDGDSPAYGASKGGIDSLTRSLAVAYAKDGIRVNAVAPGWIETPILTPFKENPALATPILARTPLGRFGQVSEIGDVVAFLCSEGASWITGAVIPVDGGYLCTP